MAEKKSKAADDSTESPLTTTDGSPMQAVPGTVVVTSEGTGDDADKKVREEQDAWREAQAGRD